MRGMTPDEVPEHWDSYPSYLDDAPASFLFNMGLGDHAPIESAPFLYLVRVNMVEPGDHGMGTPAEAQRFAWFEDQLSEAAAARGLFTAGRLRTQGRWEVAMYGAEGIDLAAVLDTFSPGDRDFEIALGGGEDPEWGFYWELLFPDRERFQWMMDRNVVMQLEDHGDDVEAPRLVDHAISFPDEKSLEAFVAASREIGCSESQRHKRDDEENPWMVELQKEDPVALGHIHGVVMELIELAEQHGGDYDGWGAPIVTTDS